MIRRHVPRTSSLIACVQRRCFSGFSDSAAQPKYPNRRSYTQAEKMKALDKWEKQLMRSTAVSSEEAAKFRHYTELEHLERLQDHETDVQREDERVARDTKWYGRSYTAHEVSVRRGLQQPRDEPPDDEEVADRKHVINLLVKAERRIKFGADYGSMFFMRHFNEAETMLQEAEAVLRQRCWTNPAIEESIAALREEARQQKYDLDID